MGRAWRAVDWLIHPRLGEEAQDLLKARLFVVCTVGLLLMGLVFGYLSAVNDPEPLKVAPSIFVGCGLGVVLLVHVRRTASLALGLVLLCLLVMALVVVVSLTSSGLYDTALWWMPLGPALAAFLVGPRFALMCAGMVVAYLALLFRLHAQGVVFDPVGPNVRVFIVGGCGSLTLALAAFGWLYDASRRRSLVMLEHTLSELKRVNAETQLANAALGQARDAAQADARTKDSFLLQMNRLSVQQVAGLTETTQVVAGIASTVASGSPTKRG